ncbi:MAG: hypothetical protein F7B59_03435 [Desulfurococcales archaeon]|nr:hypothetical protein [Desulfurococcales archaeon]
MDKTNQRKLYSAVSAIRKVQIKVRLHINRLERRLHSKRTTREEKGILLNMLRTLYYIDYVLEWMITRVETLLITGLMSSKDLELIKEVYNNAHKEFSGIEQDLVVSLSEIGDLLASVNIGTSAHVETLGPIDLSFTTLEKGKEIDIIMNEAREYADDKIKTLVEKSVY